VHAQGSVVVVVDDVVVDVEVVVVVGAAVVVVVGQGPRLLVVNVAPFGAMILF
jgi:hypothetical protein